MQAWSCRSLLFRVCVCVPEPLRGRLIVMKQFQSESGQGLQLLSCAVITRTHFAFPASPKEIWGQVQQPEWRNISHLSIGFPYLKRSSWMAGALSGITLRARMDLGIHMVKRLFQFPKKLQSSGNPVPSPVPVWHAQGWLCSRRFLVARPREVFGPPLFCLQLEY